jgi:hypothetical protein
LTRTYSRRKCYVCGKVHSVNGLARVNHMRKHVREGIMEEYKVDGSNYGWIGFRVVDEAKREELYPTKDDYPFNVLEYIPGGLTE